MTTSAVVIAQKTLAAANITLPFVQRISDMFKPEGEMVIEWTSPEYMEIQIFGEFLKFKRGERRSFIIRGKPHFCQAVLQEIQINGGTSRLLSGGNG